MANNTDTVSALGEPQRRQVVNILFGLLKEIYPTHDEYLLRRAKQYEHVCYTNAGTMQRYYELVNEGVNKIRNANGQRNAARNRATAGSSRQHLRNGSRDAVTPMPNSMQTAPQETNHSPVLTNRATNLSAPRGSYATKSSSPVFTSNDPNTTNSTTPSNQLSDPPNYINPSNPSLNSFTNQANQIPGTMENYIQTVNRPQQNNYMQPSQLTSPTLNHMIGTQEPSGANPTVSNPNIDSMYNNLGNYGATPALNPSLNRMPHRIARSQVSNPTINSTRNPGVNQMVNPINYQIPNQSTNRMANTGQPSYRNYVPTSAQTGTTALDRNTNLSQNIARVTVPTQSLNRRSQVSHPQASAHSANVDQLLLSCGLNPTNVHSRASRGRRNDQITANRNSNLITETTRANRQVPRQVAAPQTMTSGSANVSNRNQIPVSVAENAIQAIRGRTTSRSRQPISMDTIGSEGIRPSSEIIQRSRSRKRNSTAADMNQPNIPAPARRVQHRNSLNQTPNLIRSDATAPSQEQAPDQTIASNQGQAHSQSARPACPQEPASLSDRSMNERISISDGIYVTARQVYAAAASCGYNLTAEVIKGLSRDQVLRLFVRARQLSFTSARNLKIGEGGQVNITTEQLDALGVAYETTTSAQEQTGNVSASRSANQASTSEIAQQTSVSADMGTNRTDMVAPASNMQTSLNQGTPQIQSHSRHSTTRQPSIHRDSQLAGKPNSAVRRSHSSRGASSSISKRTGNLRASQISNAVSQAPVVSSSGSRANTAQVFGAPKIPANFPATTAARTIRNPSAALSHRVRKFQKKYSVYKSLISQTLSVILRQGHEGQTQVRYLRNTLQLLTQPATMGTNLTQEVLDTTENFLRDFLVRYQGIPMQSKPARSNQAGASTAREPSPVNKATKTNNSSVPVRPAAQETLAKNACIEQKTEATLPHNEETVLAPVERSQAQQSSVCGKEQDFGTGQEEIPATASAQVPVQSQPSTHERTQGIRINNGETDVFIDGAHLQQSKSVADTEDSGTCQKDTLDNASSRSPASPQPVPHEESQNSTQTRNPTPAQKEHSSMARNTNRTNESVLEVPQTEKKSEENWDQYSPPEIRPEDICLELDALEAAERMKKELEAIQKTTAVEAPDTEPEPEPEPKSLLEIVREESHAAKEKQDKLVIKIYEKWNKPIVKCLLAYQSIRLPTLVIHVGGTYRKDFYATYGFERPPLGWVPVLTDIKIRFIEMLEKSQGISGILGSWAKAAGEVLGVDEVREQ